MDLSADLAAGIRRVKGVKNLGIRLGNWLTQSKHMRFGRRRTANRSSGNEIARCLPCCSTAGFAATNSPSCPFSHLQQGEGHWAIVDLRGKAGHVRIIPVPDWVNRLLNDWTTPESTKAAFSGG